MGQGQPKLQASNDDHGIQPDSSQPRLVTSDNDMLPAKSILVDKSRKEMGDTGIRSRDVSEAAKQTPDTSTTSEVKLNSMLSVTKRTGIASGTDAAAVPMVPNVTMVTSTQNKMKKLFRRQSSTRVFPDETRVGGTECGASSPSSMDRNHSFLFSGTMIPVTMCEVPEAKEGFLSCTQLYNSLNDGQLSPLKYDPTFMLILDMRSLNDFHKQHIVLARHVSELRDGPDMEPLDAYTMLILYDHKGLSHSMTGSPLGQTLQALRAEGLDPFVLSGGFDTFLEHHPYLCTSKVATCGYERQKLIPCYPSMIVQDQLYLGRGDQATNPKIVHNLHLTHIINITRDHPNAFSGSDHLQYLKIELDDDGALDLSEQFPRGIDFIREAVSTEGAVLIHCNLGMSRSSTVVIAYLMYTHRWILRDAHRYVKERRPIIHPNNGFMRQLSNFEAILFGKRITDVTLIPGYRSYGNSSVPTTPTSRS